jgi:transposase
VTTSLKNDGQKLDLLAGFSTIVRVSDPNPTIVERWSMIQVEQRETLRQMYFLQRLPIREIARRTGVARQSIRKAISDDELPHYTLSKPRPKPRLDPFKLSLEQMLAENKTLPRKQRYTAHRIFQLLQKEGYTGSESTVRGYIGQLKKAHQRPPTFLPLEFEPGQDAQVDWGVAEAIIGGVRQTVQVFVMRLNYSRRAFVRAYPAQKQEAFFEGHVLAFQHFGGVPHRIAYDNLAAAVKILVEGRVREEQRAFVAFRSHYLFMSHFCTPGQGHEKGGVEHEVGFARRNFMVPIPQATSFEALNTYLLEQCLADEVRVVAGQVASIHQLGLSEKAQLRPLPLRHFECCVTREARLTPYSQLIYETNRYSVPVELARANLTIKAYPFRLDIVGQAEGGESAVTKPQLIASHPRCYGRQQDVFNPLHYLKLLEQRPGAFDYAKPLKRWREEWPPVYHRMLECLKAKWPEGRGVKEFIAILKLHQTHDAALVEAAVSQALEWGCVHFDGVNHCLYQQGQPVQLSLPLLDLSQHPELAKVGNQPLDLGRYDQLLKEKRG